MKFFVVEITYTAPLPEIDQALQSHRDFLQTGYDQKRLLVSGPQDPRKGGIIVARGESPEEIQVFFARDPYQAKNLATYRFIEFAPVKYQPFIADWIAAGVQSHSR
jgi:uncharacterized protein YciI